MQIKWHRGLSFYIFFVKIVNRELIMYGHFLCQTDNNKIEAVHVVKKPDYKEEIIYESKTY